MAERWQADAISGSATHWTDWACKMNRLSNADRCRVLACLVEGNSIRSTVRITGICKRTVSRLLVEFGEACERFADRIKGDRNQGLVEVLRIPHLALEFLCLWHQL